MSLRERTFLDDGDLKLAGLVSIAVAEVLGSSTLGTIASYSSAIGAAEPLISQLHIFVSSNISSL